MVICPTDFPKVGRDHFKRSPQNTKSMEPFDNMNNPWAPVGQLASKFPWAQPGKELGWDNGASALDPPTKQLQAEEENMQLAIAAAAAVAPDMIAEEQRNGGGTQCSAYSRCWLII
jgi:hypothetical protein